MTRAFAVPMAAALLGQLTLTTTAAAQSTQATGAREGRNRAGIASLPTERRDLRLESRIALRLESRVDGRAGGATATTQFDEVAARLRRATSGR